MSTKIESKHVTVCSTFIDEFIFGNEYGPILEASFMNEYLDGELLELLVDKIIKFTLNKYPNNLDMNNLRVIIIDSDINYYHFEIDNLKDIAKQDYANNSKGGL